MRDEVKAIMAASGHTEADASLILSELEKEGYRLIKFTMSVQTGAMSREAPLGYKIFGGCRS